MGIAEDAAARFNELADIGKRIVDQPPMQGFNKNIVPHEMFYEWRTRSLNALRTYLPDNHPSLVEFDLHSKHNSRGSAKDGVGILRGLADDAAEGYLYTRVANLITASVFADFLEMADHLIQSDYHAAAASLIGGVLEDTLRKLADANGVAYSGWGKLHSLNNDLLKAGVYNKVVHSQIDVWRNIRNFADHGVYVGNVKDEDVEDMLKGVRTFIAQHLK